MFLRLIAGTLCYASGRCGLYTIDSRCGETIRGGEGTFESFLQSYFFLF